MTAARQRRPVVAPADPQRAINRRWEQWLARQYPGTRWEIIRDDGEDVNEGDRLVDAADTAQVPLSACPGSDADPLGGRGKAEGAGNDLKAVR